jgi:hypothetical protein
MKYISLARESIVSSIALISSSERMEVFRISKDSSLKELEH